MLLQVVLGERADRVGPLGLGRLVLAGGIVAVVDRRLRAAGTLPRELQRHGRVLADLQATLLALVAIADAELDDATRQHSRNQATLLSVVDVAGPRSRSQRTQMPVCEDERRAQKTLLIG